MLHGYVRDWYLISGEGDCGEGDCGEGDCGEGDCGEGDCGEGDCGEGDCHVGRVNGNLFKHHCSAHSPREPPWAPEELDIVGFMIDSGLKLSHEQHEPDWQNCSLEHFALISAN